MGFAVGDIVHHGDDLLPGDRHAIWIEAQFFAGRISKIDMMMVQ